jgi:hypothetical protein
MHGGQPHHDQTKRHRSQRIKLAVVRGKSSQDHTNSHAWTQKKIANLLAGVAPYNALPSLLACVATSTTR